MKWFCEAEGPVRKHVKLRLTQSLLSQAVFGSNDPNQGSFDWHREDPPRSGSAKQKAPPAMGGKYPLPVGGP